PNMFAFLPLWESWLWWESPVLFSWHFGVRQVPTWDFGNASSPRILRPRAWWIQRFLLTASIWPTPIGKHFSSSCWKRVRQRRSLARRNLAHSVSPEAVGNLHGFREAPSSPLARGSADIARCGSFR